MVGAVVADDSAHRPVLLLVAHPALDRSRANRQLLEAARGVPGVAIRDLYELYPEFDVDVKAEQACLSAHETLVLQHPLYWYSVPALLKQWFDLVLEHGWAYGTTGRALRGKAVVPAITTGGGQEVYASGGYNHYSLEEFLHPIEQTARLCGMGYRTPFVVYGTHRMSDDELEAHGARYAERLRALVAEARRAALEEEGARPPA